MICQLSYCCNTETTHVVVVIVVVVIVLLLLHNSSLVHVVSNPPCNARIGRDMSRRNDKFQQTRVVSALRTQSEVSLIH